MPYKESTLYICHTDGGMMEIHEHYLEIRYPEEIDITKRIDEAIFKIVTPIGSLTKKMFRRLREYERPEIIKIWLGVQYQSEFSYYKRLILELLPDDCFFRYENKWHNKANFLKLVLRERKSLWTKSYW